MKNLITIFLISLLLSSCTGIKDEQLTVINGIVLGKSTALLDHSLDSLGLKIMPLYSKQMFYSFDDIKHNMFKAYVTETFNLSDFKSEQCNHLGLIYPISYQGSDKVAGVNIILCNVRQANLFDKRGFINLTKKSGMEGISQDISTNLVDKIKDMIILKYGKPHDTINAFFNDFYVVEESQINNYNGTEEINGIVYRWETEYYTVDLFEGILNVGATYNSKTKSYFMPFFPGGLGNQNRQVVLSEGEFYCYSYPFIEYKLNKKANDKLKFDLPKL